MAVHVLYYTLDFQHLRKRSGRLEAGRARAIREKRFLVINMAQIYTEEFSEIRGC
jgi:hypothetical protein